MKWCFQVLNATYVFCDYFEWISITESASRSLIEEQLHASDFLGGDTFEVGAFRQVLSQ